MSVPENASPPGTSPRPPARPRGPWSAALAETALGPRGIAKMSHLWLPCALMLSAAPPAPQTTTGGLLLLVAAVFFKVQFSILVNDLSDREDDRLAGKSRWIGRLSRGRGAAVVAAVSAAGFAAVSLSGRPWAIVAYAATVLLASAYSLRPFRFKERGLAGPAIYALSAAVVYAVLPWAWLGARPEAAAIALAAVLSDKWIQIHFHEVIDHGADAVRSTSTYAVRVGLERSRATLRAAAALAALVLAAVVGYVIFAAFPAKGRFLVLLIVSGAVIAGSGWYAARSRSSARARSTPLVRELPWIYLGLAFLAFHVLPPVLFAFRAVEDQRLLVMALLSGLSLASASRQSLRYRYR